MIVLGCAIVVVLGVWAFTGDRVEDRMVARGDVKNWSEEIPEEVPLYVADDVISSEARNGTYEIRANSNTMQTEDYYEKLLSENWRVLTPLEIDEDVNTSNRGRLRKGSLTLELYLNYGNLHIVVNEN